MLTISFKKPVSMDTLIVCLALILSIFLLIHILSKKKFDHWSKKNVIYAKPVPVLGNYGGYFLLREYLGHLVHRLCEQFPNEDYFGAYFGMEPVLIVQDPEMIKLVLTKDFYYFNGREVSEYSTREIITQNMFFTSGDRWKVSRQHLTPLFSSAKMKNMFYLIEKCAHSLEEMLDFETSTSDVIEARDLMARYTMDCICSCAFGIESNAMGKGETQNPFKIMAHQIFQCSNRQGLKRVFRLAWPAIFYALKLQSFPATTTSFFSQLLTEVFESRNHEPSSRNDFVDMILSFRKETYLVGDSISNVKTGGNKKVQLKVDDDLLVAQCVLFFAAGFETSAATLSFLLYEFAKNQDAQNRAIEEIDEYLGKRGNRLNYDCLVELPYLEACVYETLRLYPILGVITREVVDEYTFPCGLHLEKGIRVHIPAYHLHRNPNYFPDPEEFKPERFLADQKNSVKPYTFFPFGEGPRICIGKRFAKMQVLPGLLAFLKKFQVGLADGMPRNLEIDPRSFLIQPKTSGLYLKVTRRTEWERRVFVPNYD